MPEMSLDEIARKADYAEQLAIANNVIANVVLAGLAENDQQFRSAAQRHLRSCVDILDKQKHIVEALERALSTLEGNDPENADGDERAASPFPPLSLVIDNSED